MAPIRSRARGLEAIFRGWFGCWDLVQRGQETFATAAFGHLLHARPAGNLLRQGRRHDPFDGNLLPRSQLDNLAVHGVRNCHRVMALKPPLRERGIHLGLTVAASALC